MEERTLNYQYISGVIAIVVFAIVMGIMTFCFDSYWWGVALGTILGFAFGALALMQFQKRPDYAPVVQP